MVLEEILEEFLEGRAGRELRHVGTTAALFLFVVGAAVRSVGRKPVSGREGLLGALGTAKECIDPTGTVFVQGTLWSACSTSPIEAGATVRVVGVQGLKLTVEKATEGGR